MKFGMLQIQKLIELIIGEMLPYKDSVIIGDNSSGKSMLLREFLQKVKDQDQICFIDAVNRGFDVAKISKTVKKPEYKGTILATRLDEVYFNQKDSFNCYGTLTEPIEEIYLSYEQEVQQLFCAFTGESFTPIQEYSKWQHEVAFEKGIGLLSSGYQAMIRIFLELVFFEDRAIKKNGYEKAWVVIDEIDEFLSPRFSAAIYGFLKERFPWAYWMVTTHSGDLVAETKDANLIILQDADYEVTDINDYTSVSDVQLVFGRVFGRRVLAENEIDNRLRKLFHNKISNAWSPKDTEALDELRNLQLSESQRLIIRQIQEW